MKKIIILIKNIGIYNFGGKMVFKLFNKMKTKKRVSLETQPSNLNEIGINLSDKTTIEDILSIMR